MSKNDQGKVNSARDHLKQVMQLIESVEGAIPDRDTMLVELDNIREELKELK